MAGILLLEADRQLAKNITDFLVRRGHAVLSFSDPQTAISAADDRLPDLIILNLALAGRSGIEFLYELRSYPEWQSIPVMAIGRLSLEEQASYSRAFAQLGVTRFMPTDSLSLSVLASAAEQPLQPA